MRIYHIKNRQIDHTEGLLPKRGQVYLQWFDEGWEPKGAIPAYTVTQAEGIMLEASAKRQLRYSRYRILKATNLRKIASLSKKGGKDD